MRIPDNPPKKYLETIEKINNYAKINEEFFGLNSIELEINDGQFEGFQKGAIIWIAKNIYNDIKIIGKLE